MITTELLGAAYVTFGDMVTDHERGVVARHLLMRGDYYSKVQDIASYGRNLFSVRIATDNDHALKIDRLRPREMAKAKITGLSFVHRVIGMGPTNKKIVHEEPIPNHDLVSFAARFNEYVNSISKNEIPITKFKRVFTTEITYTIPNTPYTNGEYGRTVVRTNSPSQIIYKGLFDIKGLVSKYHLVSVGYVGHKEIDILVDSEETTGYIELSDTHYRPAERPGIIYGILPVITKRATLHVNTLTAIETALANKLRTI